MVCAGLEAHTDSEFRYGDAVDGCSCGMRYSSTFIVRLRYHRATAKLDGGPLRSKST